MSAWGGEKPQSSLQAENLLCPQKFHTFIVNLPSLSALGMCWLTVVSRVLPWPSLSFGKEVTLWLGDFKKHFVLRKQEPHNLGERVNS